MRRVRAGFRKWLQKKVRRLGRAQPAWGTHFWGQRFCRLGRDSDSGRPRAAIGRSAIRAHRSTGSAIMSDRTGRIPRRTGGDPPRRRCPPSQFITHNFMGLHNSLDYYRLAKNLDFVSWDNYPNFSPAFRMRRAGRRLMRGLRSRTFSSWNRRPARLGWSIFSRTPQPGELRRSASSNSPTARRTNLVPLAVVHRRPRTILARPVGP